MSDNTQHFSLTNNLSEIDQLHTNLSRFGSDNSLDKKVVFQMTLACEEILTNIISYGYEDTKEHHINFSLSLRDKKLIVMVEDDALPFNLIDAETPDLETRPEDRQVGGLGIHLIKNIIDDIDYERHDSKNFITLLKEID